MAEDWRAEYDQMMKKRDEEIREYEKERKIRIERGRQMLLGANIFYINKKERGKLVPREKSPAEPLNLSEWLKALEEGIID